MLTHDSLAYLHAADTFMAGRGFEYFGYSSPMIQWPLLMPALYGVAGLLGDVRVIMGYFNLTLFGIAVFFGGLTLSGFVKNRVAYMIAMVFMTFSLSYIKPFYYLLSEGLFLAFLSVLLFLFTRWIANGKMPFLLLLSLVSGLLMWTRFTGIVLSGLVGVYILFFTGKNFIKRVKEAAIYGGIAALPFMGLLIRNFILSGTFTGRSKPSVTPFWDNIKDTVKTIGGWFLPQYPLCGAALAGLIAAGCAFAAYLIFKKRASDGRGGSHGISVILAYTFLYPMSVIYSNTFYALDPVGLRILAPMFLPAVISIFYLLDEALARIDSRKLKTTALALSAAAALAFAVFNSWSLFADGPGFTSYYMEKNFEASPVMEYIRGIPGDVKIYTNKPGDVFFATGKDANYPPRKEGAVIYLREACDARLASSGKELYIVWYDVVTNPVLYQREELISMYSLTEVESFEGCVIYKAGV